VRADVEGRTAGWVALPNKTWGALAGMCIKELSATAPATFTIIADRRVAKLYTCLFIVFSD